MSFHVRINKGGVGQAVALRIFHVLLVLQILGRGSRRRRGNVAGASSGTAAAHPGARDLVLGVGGLPQVLLRRQVFGCEQDTGLLGRLVLAADQVVDVRVRVHPALGVIALGAWGSYDAHTAEGVAVHNVVARDKVVLLVVVGLGKYCRGRDTHTDGGVAVRDVVKRDEIVLIVVVVLGI